MSKNYLKPLKLGQLQLASNIFYSPLAGCSDFSFRKMANYYRPGLFFCEMVKMEALIRHDPNTFHMLDFDHEMHPIGAQICGSNPKIAGKAAKIIEELGFDVVDLNCGCPVDKVTKDGSGSGLLKTPEKIGEILSNMKAAVQIPVTVKIRAGWDDHTILASQITEIAETAGAAAISIHGRTREQGYRGRANWSYIKQAKEAAKAIPVFGNGDVFDGVSAISLFQETGCDGVLVSRGTLGKPWIFEEIVSALEGKPRVEPSIKKTLLKHVSYILKYQSGKKALLDIKKVGCWYLRDTAGTKELRAAINRATNATEAMQVIQHDW